MVVRSSLLECLEVLKAVQPGLTLHHLMSLLYVAEDEGLMVRDVAERGQLSQSTASRSLRALGPPGVEWTLAPGLGLVEPYLGTRDARSLELFLSPAGRKLRTRLDDIVAAGRLLKPRDEEQRAAG